MSKISSLIEGVEKAKTLPQAKKLAADFKRDRRVKMTDDHKAFINELHALNFNSSAISRRLWSDYKVELSPVTIRKFIKGSSKTSFPAARGRKLTRL